MFKICSNGVSREKILDMVHNNMSIFSILREKLLGIALFAIIYFSAFPAFAQGKNTLGDTVLNFIKSGDAIPGVIAGIAYLMGLLFLFSAILKLKDHVENANQTPIWEGIKRIITAGALFALPMVSEVLYNSIADNNPTSFGYTSFNGDTSGGGLDKMLVSLVQDIWQPMHILVAAFGYVAGLILMVVAIMRIVKSAQDGPKGPGGFGTIMTFVTAAALFSLDPLMGAFSTSIFGTPVSSTNAVMSYGNIGLSKVEAGHVHAVISAVVGFVIIIGWISFLRGWFILRGLAEGNQQASLMAAVTHLIAGALCVNIGGVLNAIQVTLKLTGVGVVFS